MHADSCLPLPKITIITPSFNQAAFIEDTIQSVLNQQYPDLEYLVIDGGSTDGTLDILRRYEGKLQWFSEKDRGQADAINKGLRFASGDVVAYLNSDDLYEPGALLAVGRYFADHPQAVWLSGRCRMIDEQGREVRTLISSYKNFWLWLKWYQPLLVLNYLAQPATFWRRSALEQECWFDETLHYAMDYDLWLRFGRRYPLHTLPVALARFRIHSLSKSGSGFMQQFAEELAVCQRYTAGLPVLLHRLHSLAIVGIYTLISYKTKNTHN